MSKPHYVQHQEMQNTKYKVCLSPQHSGMKTDGRQHIWLPEAGNTHLQSSSSLKQNKPKQRNTKGSRDCAKQISGYLSSSLHSHSSSLYIQLLKLKIEVHYKFRNRRAIVFVKIQHLLKILLKKSPIPTMVSNLWFASLSSSAI